jgi:hypothetical protein
MQRRAQQNACLQNHWFPFKMLLLFHRLLGRLRPLELRMNEVAPLKVLLASSSLARAQQPSTRDYPATKTIRNNLHRLINEQSAKQNEK